MTTTPTGNCCADCSDVRKLSGGIFAVICINPSCDCHISPTDWREKWIDLVKSIKRMEIGAFESNLEYHGEKFIESEIASTIERTRKETVDKMVEIIEKDGKVFVNGPKILHLLSPSQSE